MRLLIKFLLFFCCFGIALPACRYHPYQTTFKRHQVKEDVYTEGEEVFIGDYVICKGSRNWYRVHDFPQNYDHYVDTLLNALKKTTLTIWKADSMQNLCDNDLLQNFTLNRRKMDVDDFPSFFRIRDKGVHLIPLIHIDNYRISTMYMTPSGMTGTTGTGKQRTTFLKIAIYIYRDAELVYRKQMWYRAKPKYIDSDFEAGFNLEQAHWDTLVGKVLDEYISPKKRKQLK